MFGQQRNCIGLIFILVLVIFHIMQMNLAVASSKITLTLIDYSPAYSGEGWDN